MNGHSLLQNGSDEDFELMGDLPKEDPVILEVKLFYSTFSVLNYVILASSST